MLPVLGTTCPIRSHPHPLAYVGPFSEVASRLSSTGVSSHDFYHNICMRLGSESCHFGHLNRSFYLLTDYWGCRSIKNFNRDESHKRYMHKKKFNSKNTPSLKMTSYISYIMIVVYYMNDINVAHQSATRCSKIITKIQVIQELFCITPCFCEGHVEDK